MKFKIEQNSIDFEEMKSKLESKFPEYTFKKRTNNFLVASKTGTIGTNILIRKKKLIVVGNFPTQAGVMIYTLSLLLLGILVPLIIYYSVFHSKMKALENEIADFFREEYNLS